MVTSFDFMKILRFGSNLITNKRTEVFNMKKFLSLVILAAFVLLPFAMTNNQALGAKGPVKKKPVFTLKSTAFAPSQKIPVEYANKGIPGGANVSVPLVWSNAPTGTKSFAIIMYDRHPIANNWVHWAVTNIPAGTAALVKGASGTDKMPKGSTEPNNTFGAKGYGRPSPPASQASTSIAS